MSVLNRQLSSSPHFASFLIVMTHSSSVKFKLINFLLWIKGPHQILNFETLEWPGETPLVML